jgi:cyclopropane fatty-acyl-phospholipid synthase-like methyltransferase
MVNNRKETIERTLDSLAPSRDKWIKKNSYFYNNDYSYMKFLVGDGKRILELGCGTGSLLNALSPSCGVGVDL